MVDGWEWDETLFEGAAPYYDRGRLPYAPGLAESLGVALSLDRTGRLLDVGCGPGSVTLRFAHLFAAVVGLDADPGMLAEGTRLAAERGVANASWVQMRAEELPGGLGHFRVVTFAASFHWMDRNTVASTVRGMLDPGGVLVHVDNRHQDGTDALDADDPPPPTAEILALKQRYLGERRRAGQGFFPGPIGQEELVFRAEGFTGPEMVVVPDGRMLVRSIDEVVAVTLSDSSSTPHLFGNRLPEFERDLRALLAAASPKGRFAVRLPDNQLKIWRPTPDARG